MVSSSLQSDSNGRYRGIGWCENRQVWCEGLRCQAFSSELSSRHTGANRKEHFVRSSNNTFSKQQKPRTSSALSSCALILNRPIAQHFQKPSRLRSSSSLAPTYRLLVHLPPLAHHHRYENVGVQRLGKSVRNGGHTDRSVACRLLIYLGGILGYAHDKFDRFFLLCMWLFLLLRATEEIGKISRSNGIN